jgi:glycosyl transferase family 25
MLSKLKYEDEDNSEIIQNMVPTNIEDFENVFYINLDHRKDRKEHVEKELTSIGIHKDNIHRFNAIKLNNGAIGCTMSHIKLIQTAKDNKLPYIMICEDDIQFTDPNLFKTQINGLLSCENENEDWDVILLAGNNLPPYKRINDYCVQVTQCQTTTGYIVASHYYDILIENMKGGLQNLIKNPQQHFFYAVDKYWFLLQGKDRWLLITPLTVIQRVDYSDIEKRMTNYRKAMTDLDKTHMMKMMNNSKVF